MPHLNNDPGCGHFMRWEGFDLILFHLAGSTLVLGGDKHFSRGQVLLRTKIIGTPNLPIVIIYTRCLTPPLLSMRRVMIGDGRYFNKTALTIIMKVTTHHHGRCWRLGDDTVTLRLHFLCRWPVQTASAKSLLVRTAFLRRLLSRRSSESTRFAPHCPPLSRGP